MTSELVRIYEIVCAICGQCDKPTLAILARTNKSFSDPALEILWADLNSFSDLLSLLPEDLVTWHRQDYGPPRPMINHLIVPRDWTRFSLYAPRVRTWPQEDLSYIDETIVDHIAFGRNPGYILPRLTHLEVSATSVSGIHLQTLILCPTLQSVTVLNADPSQGAYRAMQTFFRTLADRATTSLTKLVLHWDRSGAFALAHIAPLMNAFREGLSDVFASMKHLQIVQLWSPGVVNAHSFFLLSQLPDLRTLHLNLMGTPDADELSIQVRGVKSAFSQLENVFLAGELGEFRKVLRCFDQQRIASIGFSVNQYPLADSLRTLFQAVAAQFANTLRILQFNVPHDEVDRVASTRYASAPELFHHDITVIRPLLDMHGLVAVHLELGIPLFLADDDLATIAVAWKNIEILNLCSDPFCDKTRGHRPQATVLGFFSLLSACQRLDHLGLFLDYSPLVDTTLIAACETVSSSISRLDVGRSWITNPPAVAALLSGALPNLKAFVWSGMEDAESWRDFNGGQSPAWRQVYELLPVFRAARVHERRTQSLTAVAMNID
ncbi:hypothetical protein BD410DRAFT_894090 [Rickenella mellea]|uniref:F-box domain-containing protein n=1 Tax=Rickenella mellea TaxID=50990 RepID=A0A4Y7QKL2_9AGAM|nr:hypothetical protein BD410DRAFT_894090 [Rickenella mellea]